MRRVIVDECLPRRLAKLLAGVDATTVPEAGYAGLKNGKLLAEIAGRYDVFVTIDANLEYQQNLAGLEFGIVVLHARTNRLADIEPLKDALAAAVATVEAGQVTHVRAVST